MVSSDEGVETVAVSAVLIAFNWPKWSDRYRRIEKFVQQFFPRIAEFQQPPRHPKWRETNLAATLPGWTRFPAAEEWLQRHKQQQQQQQPVAANRDKFKEFLAARGAGGTKRERLFQEFLKWSQARERR
jgi:hypothetical protein